MRRITLGLAATAVAATTVFASGGALAAGGQAGQKPADTGYTPPAIQWASTCASAALNNAGAQCGTLTVPLDYNKPKGTKIKIALSRIKAKTSADQRQGIMLVNPGGPGGSGLGLSRLGASIPKGGGDPYDWIGFDPRGVGSSEPALACDGDFFGFNRPDYRPKTRKLEKFWWKKSNQYAKDCRKAGGKLLDHLKTTDTVKDIESIRKALGESKINFYGFSYGTTIAQHYASIHPGKVRRMVLDGVTNPSRTIYQSNLDQDVAFEITLKKFFAWVAKYDDVYGLGTSGAQVYAKWRSMLAKATKNHSPA